MRSICHLSPVRGFAARASPPKCHLCQQLGVHQVPWNDGKWGSKFSTGINCVAARFLQDGCRGLWPGGELASGDSGCRRRGRFLRVGGDRIEGSTPSNTRDRAPAECICLYAGLVLQTLCKSFPECCAKASQNVRKTLMQHCTFPVTRPSKSCVHCLTPHSSANREKDKTPSAV